MDDAKVIFEACDDFQAAIDALATNHKRKVAGLKRKITELESVPTPGNELPLDKRQRQPQVPSYKRVSASRPDKPVNPSAETS